MFEQTLFRPFKTFVRTLLQFSTHSVQQECSWWVWSRITNYPHQQRHLGAEDLSLQWGDEHLHVTAKSSKTNTCGESLAEAILRPCTIFLVLKLHGVGQNLVDLVSWIKINCFSTFNFIKHEQWTRCQSSDQARWCKDRTLAWKKREALMTH